MKVKLFGKSQVVSLTLPQKVYGNYWIVNEENENLINIEAVNEKWFIKSNDDVKILQNDSSIEKCELIENTFYTFFDSINNKSYKIYTTSTFDNKMLSLKFTDTENFSFYIGNSNNSEGGKPNYISYEVDTVHYNQIEIVRTNGIYYLKNLFSDINVYVNDYVVKECYLKYGDVIFMEGLTFSIVGDMLLLGNANNKIKYVTSKFTLMESEKLDYSKISEMVDQNIEAFDKSQYFIRPPRFNEIIEVKEIKVDSPPNKNASQQLPLILTMGPMLIMAMTTSISGAMALYNVAIGQAELKDNLTSIITAFSMLLAMICFPLMTRLYQKNQKKKREKLRQEKYKEYLQEIEKEIIDEITRQKRILVENHVSLSDVGDIVLYRKRNLWERKITHPDFLTVRLGIGDVKPKIDVQYPEEHFQIEKDNLLEELKEVVKRNEYITQVPVTLSLKEKYISALIGKYNTLYHFIDGILLQLMTYQSYDELKIVIFTNNKNASKWDKIKNSPYVWDDSKQIRFYGTNNDEIFKISNFLEEQMQARVNSKKESETKEVNKQYNPHYLIITDDLALTSKTGIITSILKEEECFGFSLLYLTEKLNSLPSECSTFVSIDPNTGGVFENELVNKKQEFKPDFVTRTIDNYIYHLSNIPIELTTSGYELPSVFTFLEMYDAGNVEQLNAFNRWQQNDPTVSLTCPVGVDENGALFHMDLHEKVHGPHGLIAGMTGSGKSEFIITYILSMAINYDPKEVQFVLIDYKGGGLAGAFENKETGEKLPHLAGTITNLDVNEINRSLSSLQSELKRRQRIFNEARDKCNESTIDIYKYQKLYREGKVDEPIAHLIIISDEFAELKAQQPEFMDELISTARIGRSLGVHLILATQKPSGVVDDQIWSNAKFRVCLKVQDKADSNDMLKQPDAAYLKETGRFFLQVGFNEFFAKGQSAWAGAAYYESEKRKKMIDTSVSFVDNIGGRLKDVDTDKQDQRGIHKGEEITNVLKYLQKLGKEQGIKVKQLWLDAIPANIFVDKLKKKYDYVRKPFYINPVIGEYDAPSKQEQGLLTLPLSDVGNTLIYGMVGSGKEQLISTLIYSLMSTYTPEEVNMYVLDFGSEMLRMYSKAPHIGGVVSSTDSDRIFTLFKMLKEKIEERKALFASYNGSYDYYCKNSGKTVPMIITFINGYESFYELYENYSDDLILLSREGQKYGIIFIISVSSTNNIRMKLSQNFNEKIVLQMNDVYDYRQLLGRTETVPNKVPGRGLAKREGIYEFQSAYPTEVAELNPFITDVITNLNSIYTKKAQAIPTLPEKVSSAFVSSAFEGITAVPIGVNKETLNIVNVDLKNQLSLLVSATKLNTTRLFMENFIYQMKMIKSSALYVIDAEKLITSRLDGVNYYTGSFEKVFTSFKQIIDNLNDIYVKSDFDQNSLNNYGDMIFVIIGLNKIESILGSKFKELVADSFVTSKKLGKISYVLVDTYENFKNIEYEQWYKEIVTNNRGIWIGSGLLDQNAIKLSGNTRSILNELPYNFGYYIQSGISTLIKYVETTAQEEEQ